MPAQTDRATIPALRGRRSVLSRQEPCSRGRRPRNHAMRVGASAVTQDAWGNTLESSYDGVPGGFWYRFVGGYGCRLDPDTQLIYCRQRGLDTALQRFVSRDEVHGEQR